MDNEFTQEEIKILAIVEHQIEVLNVKAAEGVLSLDDCKKLAILHDTYNKIIHPENELEDPDEILNITGEDLEKFIDTLNRPASSKIELVKDD